MSRAVFMASGGDPFIALFAYKLFKERWYDEVSAFYINLNNHSRVPKEVIAEFLATLSQNPKVHLIYHPDGRGNGPPVAEMVHVCQEDLVLLLEDDGFIFDSGIVDKCFQKIESDLTDAVGSPRFSCGAEVGEASQKKYKLTYGGYGDVGPNFWPNFFFCKKADLLKTDLDFGSHTWQPGEFSPELNHTFKEINHGDTFVWMCVQLRALGLRFESVPQHHADPYEVRHKKTKEGNWHRLTQPFHWIHGGSLSTGWGGYLEDRTPDVSAEISKYEIETRCAFWELSAANTRGFKSFKDSYIKGLNSLIIRAGLSPSRINEKYELYKEVMKL